MSVFPVHPTCQIPCLSELLSSYYRGPEFFVDVGAFDGELHSNTVGLADLGWRGVMIEPVLENFHQCCARHAKNPHVHVVQSAAVGVDHGLPTIDISVAGEISSARASTVDFFNAGGMSWLFGGQHRGNIQEVPAFTVWDILQTLYGESCRTDGFYSIDTEGFEYPILDSIFNHSPLRPNMIVVELHEASPQWMADDPSRVDMERSNALLESFGYRKVYFDDINSVFVRKTG